MSELPLMSGPWQAMTAGESQAFLDRLTTVLSRMVGADAFTRHLPITDLRCIPLSFYPGWLLVEGQALLSPQETGLFNVLYGPGFMWVIDGRSDVIHQINTGRLPILDETSETAPGTGRFMPAALTKLEPETTGPDYLRYFCASVWGEEGPFWLIEDTASPLLAAAAGKDGSWHEHVKPIKMQVIQGGLRAEALVAYGDSLFLATFRIEAGQVLMESDMPVGTGRLAPQRYRAPFRNLRPTVGAPTSDKE